MNTRESTRRNRGTSALPTQLLPGGLAICVILCSRSTAQSPRSPNLTWVSVHTSQRYRWHPTETTQRAPGIRCCRFCPCLSLGFLLFVLLRADEQKRLEETMLPTWGFDLAREARARATIRITVTPCGSTLRHATPLRSQDLHFVQTQLAMVQVAKLPRASGHQSNARCAL